MCTSFSITAKDKSVIVARTQEFFVHMTPSIFFSAQGSSFSQDIETFVRENGSIFGISKQKGHLKEDVPTEDRLLQWESDYDFIAMSDNGKKFVVDGVNSQGLTTGMMTLKMSRYQPLDNKQYANTLLFPYLAEWILSKCSNCQDVIEQLDYSELRISDEFKAKLNHSVSDKPKIRVSNPFNMTSDFPMATISHFPVRDKDGNEIVLEYIDGKLIISDLKPFGVLTNDPQISFQQQNLVNNYSYVTPFNLQTVVYDYDFQTKSEKPAKDYDRDFQTNSEEPAKDYDRNLCVDSPVLPATRFNALASVAGCGFSALPGGSAPVDRFVRTAMMVNFAKSPNESKDAINLAYHIANTVDIPVGTSREDIHSSEAKGMDSTIFLTVCDLSNKTYTIRAYGSPSVYKIDLTKLKSTFQGLNGKTFNLPLDLQYFDITNDISKLANVPTKQVETV